MPATSLSLSFAERPSPRLFFAWACLLVFTLAWDASGLDLPLMQLLGDAHGFALRDQVFLERVLHSALRQAALLFYGLMWLWALAPARWLGAARLGAQPPRRERLAVVLLVGAALGAVNLVKYRSLTSCPWELAQFGGQARYVSHWAFGVPDGGSGRCFPGGHVSSAFALLPLCLPWLAPPANAGQRHRVVGQRWLAGILLVGAVAAVTQTVRGAHYPSHTLWTLVLCSSVVLAGWKLAQPWLGAKTPK